MTLAGGFMNKGGRLYLLKTLVVIILVMASVQIVGARIVVLDDTAAVLSNAQTTDEKMTMGFGSWMVKGDGDGSGSDDKFELYILPESVPFSLGNLTVDDISEISYHTNKPFPEGDPDFYLVIYTKPDGTDDYGWYGYRLNAEPYFSNNLNAPANNWNEWSTDNGNNQLTFFDSWKTGTYGFYGQPDLQDLQGGTINWHDYNPAFTDQDIDYGKEEILFISFQTGTGWADNFTGYIDQIKIELKSGDVLTIDLEPTREVPVLSDIGILSLVGGFVALSIVAIKKRAE